MRHRRKRRRLNRPADQRKAALRALTTCLLREKQINTTLVNAKALVCEVEKMISLAKRGDLDARRQAAGFIYDKEVVQDLFDAVSERYKDQKSGFTRIVKNGFRRGDNAQLAVVQLV